MDNRIHQDIKCSISFQPMHYNTHLGIVDTRQSLLLTCKIQVDIENTLWRHQ